VAGFGTRGVEIAWSSKTVKQVIRESVKRLTAARDRLNNSGKEFSPRKTSVTRKLHNKHSVM
jgi:hypothetical protein